MKPFGVRLAAGAVTILLGALAAAQAQKDKSSDSGSTWSVTPAQVDQPPAPIGGAVANLNNETWNGPPPSTDALAALDVDQANSMPIAENQGDIQMVQHTDASPPSEGLAFPAAGGLAADRDFADVADSGAPSGATPSLSLPPAGLGPIAATDLGETETAGSGPSMSLPLGGGLAAPTMSSGDDITGQDVTSRGSAPNLEPVGGAATNPLSPQDFEPSPQPLSADALPEVQFDQPPAMGFLGDVQPNPAPDRTEPRLAQTIAAEVDGQPANILRGGGFDSGSTDIDASPVNNAAAFPSSPPLADAPGYPPSVPNRTTQIGLAQQAAGFGQPVAGQAQLYDPNSPAPPSPAPNSSQLQAPSAQLANLPTASALGLGDQPRGLQPPPAAAQLAVDASETFASPGDRRLEGVQSPSIVIQKRAPSEVKVGKPAAFVIQVQNVGSVEALDVQVHDRIPAGMRLVDASPAPVQQGDRLLWQLGAMPAGDERTVTMQLVPEQEGELGSVARVTFEAAASVRTISTRPELKIVQKAPEKVLIGQQLEIELEVSNPGTGEATGVMLQEDVPEGLEHPKGRQLDNVIGTLAPGEVRRQILRMRAVAPGVIQNQIRLVGDDGLAAEHSVAVEVVAPQLQVALSGPSRRFLERQATFQLDIANIGTADASNIEVSVNLDRGFTFVSTDYEGQYDPSRHAVYWSLAQLPAGGQGAVPLTLLPVEEGDQAIRLEARADLGIVAKSERLVTVDALAELTFQIADAADPIEIGSETTYEIRVSNSGSRNDNNIQVQLQLPSGLELVSSENEAGTNGRGLVAFQPRPQLAAGGDMVYRVRVRGVAPGTHLVKAIVTSDQATVPVTKEESTMVYADR